MGRIKKSPTPKHEASLPPPMATFVKTATSLPLHELPRHLATLDPRWAFPRGDLYNWIPLLNRFDHDLELFIREYRLKDGPQTQPFTRRLLLEGDHYDGVGSDPTRSGATEMELNAMDFGPEGDREAVEAVLRFSTLLLENCGNRSLYSSSEHLNDLLNTTSLDLLSRTLRLAVRCAQRYLVSRQRTVGVGQHLNPALLASHYNINLDKVLKLAQPFVRSVVRSDSTPQVPPVTSVSKGKEKAWHAIEPVVEIVHASDLMSIARGDVAAAATPTSNPTTEPASSTPRESTGQYDWTQWGHITYSYPPSADPESKTSHDIDGPAREAPTGPTAIRRSPTGVQSTPRRSRLSGSEDAPSASNAASPAIPGREEDDQRHATTKTIEIDYAKLASTSTHELLATTLPDLPAESRFDFAHRVRTASALVTSLETRRQILGIRILAITNLAYIHPEPVFQQKILQQDSDEPRRWQLAYQLAELVHPQGEGNLEIPRWLQTLAIGGLEALAKHKSKVGDVGAALSVNVNHGVLLYVIRKAVAEMADDGNDQTPAARDEDEWRDALFALLGYLPETARTGEALLTAGLLPILLEVLTLRTAKAERNHPKVLLFLDTFVYHLRDAFPILANARGLEIISQLTSDEVTTGYACAQRGEGMPLAYQSPIIDYELPFFQRETLRALFKFLNHVMSHAGGNFDRLLRNLIDSPPLLRGLHLVLSNAKVFGSNVWSGASNIMSNFIHNEPTSYAVIAEAGLTRAFLEAVGQGPLPDVPGEEMEDRRGSETDAPAPALVAQPDTSIEPSAAAAAAIGLALELADNPSDLPADVDDQVDGARRISSTQLLSIPLPHGHRAIGILPSSDAILTVPQAFGAICLNAGGMALFEKSLALPCFFEIFLSPAHVKCLHADKELSGILGGCFDELVRHHPPLKKSIMISVLSTLVSVGKLCRARASEDGVGAKLWVVDATGQVAVAGGQQALRGTVPFSPAPRLPRPTSDVEVAEADADEVVPDANRVAAHYQQILAREEAPDRPSVSTYLEVLSRFLIGFFAHPATRSTFIAIGGAEWLLDLAELPSLQFDYNNTPASRSFAKCVHTLIQAKPSLVLPSVICRAQAAVDELQTLVDADRATPFFISAVQKPDSPGLSPERISSHPSRRSGTDLVKSLVKVHTLCHILRETFAQSHHHARVPPTLFIQVNLADMYVQLVTSLGALQQFCAWEESQLQILLPTLWKEAGLAKCYGSGNEEVDQMLGIGLVPAALDRNTSADGDASGITSTSAVSADSSAAAALAHSKNSQTLRYLLKQVSFVITPLLQGLGKALSVRRQAEGYLRLSASAVADAIAAATIAQLRFKPPETATTMMSLQPYWVAMLNSLSIVLVDLPQDRQQSHCVTMVLLAFKNKGGFDALKAMLDVFFEEVRTNQGPAKEPEAFESSSPLTTAYTGIKIILGLFADIVATKTVLEAAQTTAMTSRDRDKHKPDYFSPNQFLVEIRAAVLPIVQWMWESQTVDRAQSVIAGRLINILRIILEGDYESGAYRRSDMISRRDKVAPKPWKESPQHQAKLIADGYYPELVREALYRCNNNGSVAEEYCKALRLHDRALRLPIPDRKQRAVRPKAIEPASSGPSAAAETAQATDAPPAATTATASTRAPSTGLDMAPMEIGEGHPSQSSEGSRPAAPPPPPSVPVALAQESAEEEEDLPDNEGLLAMNLDNLLGNLQQLNVPTPPQRREISREGSTGPPSRENCVEIGKVPEIVTLDDLDEQRVTIRARLIDRALDILNVHSDVTYDLSRLIMAAVSKLPNAEALGAEIGETLVQSLISLQMEDDFRPAGKKIAAYANLLALILRDKFFYELTLPELKPHFNTLLGFIKVFPEGSADHSSPWIGQILLIIEKLLAEDTQPRPIKWTPPAAEDGSVVDAPIAELGDPIVSDAGKTQLFDAIIQILPRIGRDGSLALSVARALVMLTRSRNLARRLGERQNLQRLFVMVKQLAGMTTDKLQAVMMLVLRHIVEDEETVKQIMRSEIKIFFESRQNSRQLDTNSFVRSLYHLVLRNPELFVEVSNEMLKLQRFDPTQRHQILSLREINQEDAKGPALDVTVDGEPAEAVTPNTPEAKETDPTVQPASGLEKARTPHTEIKAPIVESSDGVIHYLLSELLSYKEVDDKETAAPKRDAEKAAERSSTPDVEMIHGDESPSSSRPNSPLPPPIEPKKSDKVEFRAEQHPIYIYRCFLLQCLTELLSCYNRTKVEFINFSRKAGPAPVMTPTKPRSGVLNYILNDLMPVGTLNTAETWDIPFRKRYSTSNWSIAVIVALCSKTGEKSLDRRRERSDGEDEPDLLFVRKFVLEHALKSYRDASASMEAPDVRYARMLCLADLFNRMLTGRPISGGNTAAAEMLYASQKQLARIMFEKNYIAALTSSIADIDLNFPSAKRAVKYILRPLKSLTQTAIELSETSSLSTPGQTEEEEISSATSVSDVDGREETPDLFRNSTLGMIEPGREPESSSVSSDDEDDDEMYDDGEEMEFDEEVGGDDEDDVISDEEEELNGMEGLPGDLGMNVEVVLNGGDDGMGTDEDEDEEEDEDEMDEDEDEDDDEEAGVEEGEDLEIVDELDGDDVNESATDGGEDEWQSDDGGEEDYDDDGEEPLDSDGRGINRQVRDAHLEQIVRALDRDNGGALLHQLEGGGALQIDVLDPDYMEDAMQDEDEDEDDDEEEEEEMDDDGEGAYDHDLDGPGQAWEWHREQDEDIIAHGARHHPHHRHSPGAWSHFLATRRQAGNGDAGFVVPAYRSHQRPTGPTREITDGTNPLLWRAVDTPAEGTIARDGRPDGINWPSDSPTGPPNRFLGFHDNPTLLINNIMTAIGQGAPLGQHPRGGELHFHVSGPPWPGQVPREVQAMIGSRRIIPDSFRSPNRDDPAHAVSFHLSVTSARWQEEARILFGNDSADKTSRVINALLSLLVPPAIQAEKARRALKEKLDKKRAEEVAARQKKEAEEREVQEKLEREVKEAAEATALAAAAEAVAHAPLSSDEGAHEVAADEEEGEMSIVQDPPDPDRMEGVESTQTQPVKSGADESAPRVPVPSARVHTTIRGQELDITGMDIDPEYLAALPEELREEVIRQQAISGDQPTDISREFLEALPADIREELLEQEAQDRRRREREEARRAGAAAAGGPPVPAGAEMDPTTILATLDPVLRQAILMEQDDDVLAQLPSALAAEARALGGEHRLRPGFMNAGRSTRRGAVDMENPRVDVASKKAARRAIVQMVDKAGVATLLRLMFIPQQGSARQTLNGILQNVCENRQTRQEVVTLLLSILQDGSADTSAVERSFAHLSLRARQSGSKTAPVAKRISQGSAPSQGSDMSPLMVIQQCLSSLVLLVHYNPHIPSFFLTEHDTAIGLKRTGHRKGKGKESRASRYALNALLGLLERKLIMESSPVMEQLSSLLNSVTQPLTMLLKKERERDRATAEGDGKTTVEGSTSEVVVAAAPSEAIAEAESRVASRDATANSNATDAQGDRSIPDAPVLETVPEAEGGTSSTTAEPNLSEAKSDEDGASASKKAKHPVPPFIPEHHLRLVVNILAARECSSKTFRDTLSTINNLSAIPEAKEVFGNELLRQAQDLGQAILQDLTELIPQISRAQSGTDVQGMALAKFSPASSDQAKLLRVLTALDYLYDAKKNGVGKPSGAETEAAGPGHLLSTLYENATFGPLWSKLSECLRTIRARERILNVATILLPLIEALMVVCKNTTLKPTGSSQQALAPHTPTRTIEISSPEPELRSESLETLFFQFTEEHRKILNDLVRHNPKLMSGTFSLLVKNPKVLEFDNKRNYFTRRLHARGAESRQSQPPLQLSVRREQVFPDSFKALYFKTGEEIKYGKLSIRFHGEEGVDAGGLTREWFQSLSRQMFNPDYALFTPVASDRTTFHPNRLSKINEEHLVSFKFIGRIIGKALYEGRVLDCHFSRAVYKRILGRPVSVKDMETLDLEYYKSLRWMLENDITDIITVTFAVESEDFGESRIIDLKEDGRNIAVTEENKQEYVRLVLEYRLTGSIQEQLEHFLRGFHDVVPAELIAIFNEQELELLISGLPDIDVDDWKNNTEYHNYSTSSQQIQWFWRAVRSFDKEERAKLLQFVTGTSKVPLNGFKELEGMNGFSRFNIQRDYRSKDRLPSSHTCFNQLDLPEYDSYDLLRKQVYIAMTAGSEYFGFA